MNSMTPRRIVACLVLASALLLPGAAMAKSQGKTLAAEEINRDGKQYALPLEYNVLCIDGYKYLFVYHARPNGEFPFAGLTQMFENRGGVSVPERCN